MSESCNFYWVLASQVLTLIYRLAPLETCRLYILLHFVFVALGSYMLGLPSVLRAKKVVRCMFYFQSLVNQVLGE